MAPLSTTIHNQLLNNLSSAVIWLDHSLNIQYMNSAAEALFEISGTRLKGEPLDALRIVQPNPIEDLANHALSGAIFSQHEAEIELKSGTVLTIDCYVSPMIHNDSISLLVEIQSIDRQLKINREENLLAIQETSKTLIRGLAHEIKNPLGGIRGAAQLLERLHDDVGDYTQIIISEVDRLRTLVDSMLGPNKQCAKKSANIHEVLDRVIQLTHVEYGDSIDLERDYDPSIPDFAIDKEQLLQATLNITRNAMQAMHENGTQSPKLTLRSRVLRQFTIGDTRHKLVCEVNIIDNGPGIPKHLLDKLFFPMVSGRAEGTGLGLSIAQAIVQRHDGLIECTNEAQGTRFTLYLPLE